MSELWAQRAQQNHFKASQGEPSLQVHPICDSTIFGTLLGDARSDGAARWAGLHTSVLACLLARLACGVSGAADSCPTKGWRSLVSKNSPAL